MTAKFCILLTERTLSNIVRHSGIIFRKLAALSCMEEDNMLTVSQVSIIHGNLESVNFSFWILIILELILWIKYWRRKVQLGESLMRCSRRGFSTTFAFLLSLSKSDLYLLSKLVFDHLSPHSPENFHFFLITLRKNWFFTLSALTSVFQRCEGAKCLIS